MDPDISSGLKKQRPKYDDDDENILHSVFFKYS